MAAAVGRNTPDASECYFDDMSSMFAQDVVEFVHDAGLEGEDDE